MSHRCRNPKWRYDEDGKVILSKKERALIASLEKLATRWKKDGKRIWVYCRGESMDVFPVGDDGYEILSPSGSPEKSKIITSIDGIYHDGGDY